VNKKAEVGKRWRGISFQGLQNCIGEEERLRKRREKGEVKETSKRVRRRRTGELATLY